MKKIPLNFTAAFILVCLFFNTSVAQHLVGLQASKHISGANEVAITSGTSIPQYISFNENQSIRTSDFLIWSKNNLQIATKSTLKLSSTQTDQTGMTHQRYQQYINQIPVEGSMYIVHSDQDRIKSMNGFLISKSEQNSVSLSKEQALLKALDFMRSSDYEVLESQLVYAPINNKADATYAKAYKFDMYSHQPLDHQLIYINATDGTVQWTQEMIQEIDSVGSALSAYSGIQAITTKMIGPDSFELKDMTRGSGISTFNLASQYNYYNASTFTDEDNYWDLSNAAMDEVAIDAQWGAVETYDYFLNNFGLNSLDGNGMAIKTYVHYGQQFVNAFWDGSRISLGDGNNTYSPLTSLDIIAHELTHGVTSYSAKLIYSNESGALNESFSDIFGTAVNFYARPDSARWDMGHDIGHVFRSLINPKSCGHPDTYLGNYWYSGAGDNGGVHKNSGVQNHWFYLLSEGGSGTNDKGNQFTVNGIGIDKAAAIAYRNLSVYLFPNATYADARFYAIKAAEDLFGTCSAEYQATINAWYAVGVGAEYSTQLAVDFEAEELTSCNGNIIFENKTKGTVIAWAWDFGDGTSSSMASPIHEFAQNGEYTIRLTAYTCGTSITSVKPNYIEILRPVPPKANTHISICGEGKTNISVMPSGGEIKWFESSVGGQAIANGSDFETDYLTQSKTYYVEEDFASPNILVGLPDTNAALGGYVTATTGGLKFDAYKPLNMKSVKVYAENTGMINISLNDDNTSLADTSIYVYPGENELKLDFDIHPEDNLELLVSGNVNLYRNYGSLTYPYTVPGILSITGATGGSPNETYYYFYDWQLGQMDCKSERKAITVEVLTAPQANIIINQDPNICLGEEISLTASPAHQFLWSTGDTTRSILVSKSDAYYVELTALNGCSKQSEPLNIITHSIPISNFKINDDGMDISFINTSENDQNWYWDFGDGFASTEENPSHKYADPGNYMVSLTSFNGTCSDEKVIEVNVTAPTGLSFGESDLRLSAYPNPTSGNLFINFEPNVIKEGNLELNIYNMYGQLIRYEELQAMQGKDYFMVDLSSLPASMYIVELHGIEVNESMSVVKD